jgi:hypothetical protein
MEAQTKITNDLVEGKITYYEYLDLLSEIYNPPLVPSAEVAQRLAAGGKAWVIQDIEVQGSGRAIVFKIDGGFESYERRLGVWSPSKETTYRPDARRYEANENRINIKTDGEYHYASYDGDYTYSISGNGSTLTISDRNTGSDERGFAAGTYALMDAPKVAPPGGNMVNAAGTAWEDYHNGRSAGGHDIFHSDGIQYSLGGSGYGPWDFSTNWFAYTADSATGKLTRQWKERHDIEELNYSVTDFGSGNKTLRLWKISKDFPHDTVWKLVPTPSGFQLPKVR